MMTFTSCFVTGTDTEVGKTRVSVGLIALLQQQGLTTAGMKPIASGCERQQGRLVNEDALALMRQANLDLPYELVNPYAFEPAIAPHIAAAQAGQQISLASITAAFEQISARAEAVVVEGAGGWLVPLNDRQTMADLATALQLPVVLVVDIKLGCINHALLSAEAIRGRGLTLAGWVANHTRAQDLSGEIIASIGQRIEAPCLGIVPCLAPGEQAVTYLKREE